MREFEAKRKGEGRMRSEIECDETTINIFFFALSTLTVWCGIHSMTCRND
jgi:hypothetical protein